MPRAGPPGQRYISHGLLEVATLLWRRDESEGERGEIFAQALIDMLLTNLEDLTETAVGNAMDALRMMLYCV